MTLEVVTTTTTSPESWHRGRLALAYEALAEADDLPDFDRLIDQAEALRVAAQAAGLSQQGINAWTQYKIECQVEAARRIERLRELGLLLTAGGDRRSNSAGRNLKLSDYGIDGRRAAEWAKLAVIPDETRHSLYEQIDIENWRLSEDRLIKLSNDLQRQQPPSDAPTPEVPEGQYLTIIADPPWQYDNRATRAAAEDHYPTLSIADLCALEVDGKHVSQWAAEQAHLYLWTTNGFLREAFDIVDNWGFTYKTTLVWVKKQLGIGNYFRSSHEFVLFAVRGNLRVKDSNQWSWFEDEGAGFKTDRGRHSQKPAAFYDLVEKVSPGPYLELFARTDMFGPRAGWTPWGNQA